MRGIDHAQSTAFMWICDIHDSYSFDAATGDNETEVAFVEHIDEYDNDLIQCDGHKKEQNVRDQHNEGSVENVQASTIREQGPFNLFW